MACSATSSGSLTRAFALVEEIEPGRGQVEKHVDRVVVLGARQSQTLIEPERRPADRYRLG